MPSAVRVRWSACYAAFAAGLAAMSFMPWFRYDVDRSGASPLSHDVDAWRGSTLWTFAVLLALAAAVLGVRAVRRAGHAHSLLTICAGLFAAALSASLWVRQWWLITYPPPIGTLVVTSRISPGRVGGLATADPYHIERDSLPIYAALNGLGQRAWITGWSYMAFALVILLALCLGSYLFFCRKPSRDT